MIKRDLSSKILEMANYFPVISILGPRQSGKTTLVKNLFPKHIYVSLEDYDVRSEANDDPRRFLNKHSNEFGVILDEIQHAPKILSYIQTIVDTKNLKGYFVLTGSQNILVNESITQTLAGRQAIFKLFPLSISELSNAGMLPNSIEDAIFKGCYPKAYSTDTPPKDLYNFYVNSYIERDVRQIKNILNMTLFQKFLQLCAGRIGQVINFSSLANDCGIDHKTAQAWIALLESTYVLFLLQPYYKNMGKRLIKAPKLYFVDTGVACSILNIKTPKDLESHYLRGGLTECYVISDLFKQYFNKSEKPALYFWRDYKGNEIDCIIEKQSQTLFPIEIKSGQTVNNEYFKQFEYWNNEIQTNNIKKFVIYGGESNQYRSIADVISWKNSGNIIDEIENNKKI